MQIVSLYESELCVLQVIIYAWSILSEYCSILWCGCL